MSIRGYGLKKTIKNVHYTVSHINNLEREFSRNKATD